MAGSINVDFFQNLSPVALVIKIWDYSYHVHHTPLPDNLNCNCQFYLNCYTEAAREQLHEDYIFFETVIYRFQFRRKEFIELMSIKNECALEHFIECILRDQ